jgi:hypothetical protein
VLKYKPCSFRPVFSDLVRAWPAVLLDDALKVLRVLKVHSFHHRVVALEEGAHSAQLFADRIVAVPHLEQLAFQVVEHFGV